jgi:hypothetical protein
MLLLNNRNRVGGAESMLDNTVMLDIWLQSLQVLCDLEGAKAENAFRESRGLAQAYGEEHFEQLCRHLQTLRKGLS